MRHRQKRLARGYGLALISATGFLAPLQWRIEGSGRREITGRFSRALVPTSQPPCIGSHDLAFGSANGRNERALEACIRLKQSAPEVVLNLALGGTSLRAATFTGLRGLPAFRKLVAAVARRT